MKMHIAALPGGEAFQLKIPPPIPIPPGQLIAHIMQMGKLRHGETKG